MMDRPNETLKALRDAFRKFKDAEKDVYDKSRLHTSNGLSADTASWRSLLILAGYENALNTLKEEVSEIVGVNTQDMISRSKSDR